jgi:hypothetical protein
MGLSYLDTVLYCAPVIGCSVQISYLYLELASSVLKVLLPRHKINSVQSTLLEISEKCMLFTHTHIYI